MAATKEVVREELAGKDNMEGICRICGHIQNIRRNQLDPAAAARRKHERPKCRECGEYEIIRLTEESMNAYKKRQRMPSKTYGEQAINPATTYRVLLPNWRDRGSWF